MPTISGMRRRGYTPEAIRTFCEEIGVAKNDNMVDVALLEHCVREHLNEVAPRVMAVLDPIRLVIDNYPGSGSETFTCPYHPQDPSRGAREVPFSRELFVERDDFREDPPKKWHRLAPGREVRLRYACLVTVTDVVKDDDGNVVELRCTWDPESRGGNAPDGRKVRGTLHWVSAAHGLDAEVRLYDRLFSVEDPMESAGQGGIETHLNPDSLQVRTGCKVEPSLASISPGEGVQFERLGYFCADEKDCAPGRLVFNRTVALRDSWARIERSQKKKTRKG